MAWNKILQLVFTSSLMLAHPAAPPPPTTPVAADERLSYECAKSLTTLVRAANEQTGPLFSEGKLVFTSIETQGSSQILLVNAGYGNFAVTLESSGVNRMRFDLPINAKDTIHFFISYLHGGSTLRSRYFEYAEGRPLAGHDELDYSRVTPRRAENLTPHLNYAIHETAEATLQALTEGKIRREQLARHKIENCEQISRQSPKLAQLDMLVSGPQPLKFSSSRIPASVH